MYLGVHSPADIVSGGIVGVIVLSLWVQVCFSYLIKKTDSLKL